MQNFLSRDIDFLIPAHQVAVYILIIILCLLFTKYRAGLLISFCYTFYWVFIINRNKIQIYTGGDNAFFMGLYLLSGAIVVALGIWSFYMEE
ncbi:MAG: hypothetical protein KAI43_14515 [Candidatus Aureabacteria bacterium]|nr:hypothetical protein [Candidatus Auribacterota bacterium]